MGLWKPEITTPPFEKALTMMELYIETLTGTSFELRVSPYETIQDVKQRIQKLEGIPMSQQHLVWQTMELEDDYSLQDYGVQDGTTLKLVLTMRGGPINTRRVPVEDASLREMAEYFSEANREELMDKLPGGNRPVTVIVYHNGDQLNFFRVVDRDIQSPMSESLSGASMYNLYDEEEEDVEGLKEKLEENDKTRNKMKFLRSKMENMNITKKPKQPSTTKTSSPPPFMPHPPSGRPHSMSRLRFPSNPSIKPSSGLLNRSTRLPPVGHVYHPPEEASVTSPNEGPIRSISQMLGSKESSSISDGKDEATARVKFDQEKPPRGIMPLSSVQEDEAGEIVGADISTAAICAAGSTDKQEVLEAILRRASSITSKTPRKPWEVSRDVLLKNSSSKNSGTLSRPISSSDTDISRGAEPSISSTMGAMPAPPLTGTKKLSPSASLQRLISEASDSVVPPTPVPKRQISLDALAESISNETGSASRQGGRTSAAGRGVILETLNPSEVRAVSGLLSSYVQRTSARTKSRNRDGRRTPESSRIVSARFQRTPSGHKDGRISPRLPPMKHKKKTSKRCYLCGKKTGLATSYPCRCGENFCANHRYAESHSCTFDYKTEGRKLLQQSNPVVTAPKLPKI